VLRLPLQGYASGTNTSNDMVGTFTGDSLLVPPEITNHSLYGANLSNPQYFNHTNLSLKTDQSCGGCHGALSSANYISFLMHNVVTGSAGPDCISCHDYGTPTNKSIHKVNNSAMNGSLAVHRNLNSNATSTVSSENEKCWVAIPQTVTAGRLLRQHGGQVRQSLFVL